MGRVRVWLDPQKLAWLRNSPPVRAELGRVAEQLAQRAGPGYATDGARIGKPGRPPVWNKRRGKGMAARGRAIVYPDSPAAFRDSYKNNTLSKLVAGGW